MKTATNNNGNNIDNTYVEVIQLERGTKIKASIQKDLDNKVTHTLNLNNLKNIPKLKPGQKGYIEQQKAEDKKNLIEYQTKLGLKMGIIDMYKNNDLEPAVKPKTPKPKRKPKTPKPTPWGTK